MLYSPLSVNSSSLYLLQRLFAWVPYLQRQVQAVAEMDPLQARHVVVGTETAVARPRVLATRERNYRLIRDIAAFDQSDTLKLREGCEPRD